MDFTLEEKLLLATIQAEDYKNTTLLLEDNKDFSLSVLDKALIYLTSKDCNTVITTLLDNHKLSLNIIQKALILSSVEDFEDTFLTLRVYLSDNEFEEAKKLPIDLITQEVNTVLDFFKEELWLMNLVLMKIAMIF